MWDIMYLPPYKKTVVAIILRQLSLVLAHYVTRSVLEMLVGLVLFLDLRPWTRPMLEWASIYVHMYGKKLHMGTGDVQIT